MRVCVHAFTKQIAMMSTQHWRFWYRLARWKRMRVAQLRSEPFCRMCSQDGRAIAATIVDHIEPHRGDWNRFWLGRLQSLCEHCHNSRKRLLDRNGFSSDVGFDGMPIDPAHPFNRGTRTPANTSEHLRTETPGGEREKTSTNTGEQYI